MGAKSNVTLYLLPGLRQGLVTGPVKLTVKAKRGLEVKEREPGVWLLRPEERAETSLEISGEVPAGAKAGDVLLVNVAATYPRIKGRAARTVEFLEFVFVTDKKLERRRGRPFNSLVRQKQAAPKRGPLLSRLDEMADQEEEYPADGGWSYGRSLENLGRILLTVQRGHVLRTRA